jgi:hypothetical protein
VTHFSNVPADSRYQLMIATTTNAVAAAPKEKSIDWLVRSAQYDGVITAAACSCMPATAKRYGVET